MLVNLETFATGAFDPKHLPMVLQQPQRAEWDHSTYVPEEQEGEEKRQPSPHPGLESFWKCSKRQQVSTEVPGPELQPIPPRPPQGLFPSCSAITNPFKIQTFEGLVMGGGRRWGWNLHLNPAKSWGRSEDWGGGSEPVSLPQDRAAGGSSAALAPSLQPQPGQGPHTESVAENLTHCKVQVVSLPQSTESIEAAPLIIIL